MTTVSFHARTGEIIGALGFTQAQAVPYVNNRYSGDPSGWYFSNQRFWDGIASMWLGITPDEFRALPSSLIKLYRDKAETQYGHVTGGSSSTGKAVYTSVLSLVGSSSFASGINSQQRSSSGGLTATGANVQAELLVGFIPEWGGGTSQANLDAKALAIKKMGWSHNKTVEFAKACRRERSISIQSIFNKMIKYRNQGLSASATAKKCIDQ